MHNLITQGKVLYWGTSEWTRAAADRGAPGGAPRRPDAADDGAAANTTCSSARRSRPTTCRSTSFGLGTTIWSPLASGLLTGKYNDGIPADSRAEPARLRVAEGAARTPRRARREIEKVKQLAVLAKEVGLPIHHMALLWCNANPHVSTVILGASKKSQLDDNLKALDSKAKMTPDVMAKIERSSATSRRRAGALHLLAAACSRTVGVAPSGAMTIVIVPERPFSRRCRCRRRR